MLGGLLRVVPAHGRLVLPVLHHTELAAVAGARLVALLLLPLQTRSLVLLLDLLPKLEETFSSNWILE